MHKSPILQTPLQRYSEARRWQKAWPLQTRAQRNDLKSLIQVVQRWLGNFVSHASVTIISDTLGQGLPSSDISKSGTSLVVIACCINDERDFFFFFLACLFDYVGRPRLLISANSISNPSSCVSPLSSFCSWLQHCSSTKMKFLNPIAVILSLASSIALGAEAATTESSHLRGEEVKYQGCQ